MIMLDTSLVNTKANSTKCDFVFKDGEKGMIESYDVKCKGIKIAKFGDCEEVGSTITLTINDSIEIKNIKLKRLESLANASKCYIVTFPDNCTITICDFLVFSMIRKKIIDEFEKHCIYAG